MRWKALRAKLPGGTVDAVIVFLIVQLLPVQLGVELGCSRIIQEALASTLKHPGASTAQVSIGSGGSDVMVRMADDGGGASLKGLGSGQGLIGSLPTGRRPAGGYLVEAALRWGGRR